MRVLLTTDTIGGVWTYTKELTEGLLERGHFVALVSFGRLPSNDQKKWLAEIHFRYIDQFRYVASAIPLEWMNDNECSYTDAEALLLDIVRDCKADLLHSNQFCFGKLPVQIPKLVVAHSDVLSWAAACEPAGLPHTPWLDRYRKLVQTGLTSADTVVAPTHWMLEALAGGFVVPSSAHVISNGRDISGASSSTIRQLQAVTVGRLWDEAKGFTLLAEVQSLFPILVAGEVQQANEIAPTSIGRATFVGSLTDERLLDLLRSSSIYLALSKYEPFGLAPVEAALCGCAVVARDIPSFREVWGDAALYFSDAPALTSVLTKVGSSADLLREFQNRAIYRALQFNRSRMTELYLKLYRHLLMPAHSTHSGLSLAEVPLHAP